MLKQSPKPKWGCLSVAAAIGALLLLIGLVIS